MTTPITIFSSSDPTHSIEEMRAIQLQSQAGHPARFELYVSLIKAHVYGGGIPNDCFAKVAINDVDLLTTGTASPQPEWNESIFYNLPDLSVSSSSVVTVSVYKKRWTAKDTFKLVGSYTTTIQALHSIALDKLSDPMEYVLVPPIRNVTLSGTVTLSFRLRTLDGTDICTDIKSVQQTGPLGGQVSLGHHTTRGDIRLCGLSEDVERVIKANGYRPFVAYDRSTDSSIVVLMYENQRWQPFLKDSQKWGSIVGIHLHSLFDRAPFSDESGSHSVCGSLEDAKPIRGFKWATEWEVLVDAGTDKEGFKYANNWSLIADKYNPYSYPHTMACVRRRCFVRTLVSEEDYYFQSHSMTRPMPYNLQVTIKRGTINGGGYTSSAFVEMFVNGEFYDTTIHGPAEWEKIMDLKFITLNPTMMLAFYVYTDPLLANASSLIASTMFSRRPSTNLRGIHASPGKQAGAQLRGMAKFPLGQLINSINKGRTVREFQLTPKGSGCILLGLELRETSLFTIKSSTPVVNSNIRDIIKNRASWKLLRAVYDLDNVKTKRLMSNVMDLIPEMLTSAESTVLDALEDVRALMTTAAISSNDFASAMKYSNDESFLAYPYGKCMYSSVTMFSAAVVHTSSTRYHAPIADRLKLQHIVKCCEEDNCSLADIEARTYCCSSVFNSLNERHFALSITMDQQFNGAIGSMNPRMQAGRLQRALPEAVQASLSSQQKLLQAPSQTVGDYYYSKFGDIFCIDVCFLTDSNKLSSFTLRWDSFYEYITCMKYFSKSQLNTRQLLLLDSDFKSPEQEKWSFRCDTLCSNTSEEAAKSSDKGRRIDRNNSYDWTAAKLMLDAGSRLLILSFDSNGTVKPPELVGLNSYNELVIDFDKICGITYSHAHYLNWTHVLELEVESVTLPPDSVPQFMTVELDSYDGQHADIGIYAKCLSVAGDVVDSNSSPTSEKDFGELPTKRSLRILINKVAVTEDDSDDDDAYGQKVVLTVRSAAHARNSSKNIRTGGWGYTGTGTSSKHGNTSAVDSSSQDKNESKIKNRSKSFIKRTIPSIFRRGSETSEAPSHSPSSATLSSVWGRVPYPFLPFSQANNNDYAPDTEKIMLRLNNSQFSNMEFTLTVFSMEKLLAVDKLTMTSDPYFKLYFADWKGFPIGATVEEDESLATNICNAQRILPLDKLLMKSQGATVDECTESSKANGTKISPLFTSAAVSKSLNPIWNKTIVFDGSMGSKYAYQMSKAKYILIEVWDANDFRKDVCLGEVYVPLVSASDAKLKDSPQFFTQQQQHMYTRHFPLQRNRYMKSTKEMVALGSMKVSLFVKTLASRDRDKATVDAASSSERERAKQQHGGDWPSSDPSACGNNIFLTVTSRVVSLRSRDCAWPARIFSSNTSASAGGFLRPLVASNRTATGTTTTNSTISTTAGAAQQKQSRSLLEPILHLFPAPNGLYIAMFANSHIDSDNLQNWPAEAKLFADCVESLSSVNDFEEYHEAIGGRWSGFNDNSNDNNHGPPLAHVLLPYNQLLCDEIVILTEAMMLIPFTITRLLRSNVHSGTGTVPVVRKEVNITLLVGPCPAEDMFVVLRNKYSLSPLRTGLDHLAKSLSTNEDATDSLPLVDALVDELERDLLTTVQDIAAAQDKDNSHDEREERRGTNEIDDSQISMPSRGSNDPVGSHFGNHIISTFWTCSKLLPIEVLSRKKALLRCYFWYMLELTAKINEMNRQQPVVVSASHPTNREEYFPAVESPGTAAYDKETPIKYSESYISMLLENLQDKISTETGLPDTCWSISTSTSIEGIQTQACGAENDNTRESDDDVIEIKRWREAQNAAANPQAFVHRVKHSIEKLKIEVRNLIFENHRINRHQEDALNLINQLVYGYYLVIVQYLSNVVTDGVEWANNSDASAITSATLQAGTKDSNSDLKSEVTALLTAGLKAVQHSSLSSVFGVMRPYANTGESSTRVSAAVHNLKDDTQQEKNKNDFNTEAALNNPQNKRDLISFIITSDQIFQQSLEAYLCSCNYRFSTAPNLSTSLNYDDLITQFESLLRVNLDSWNARTWKYFLSHKDDPEAESLVSISPWDIRTLTYCVRRTANCSNNGNNIELFVSDIPETVQEQLNVQIGLKKIPLSFISNVNAGSLRRISDINSKICHAVSRAYVGVASEFEQGLKFVVDKYFPNAATFHGRKFRHVSAFLRNIRAGFDAADGASGVGTSTATPVNHEKMDQSGDEATNLNDDMLCFLISIINDCERIRHTHIKESIKLFIEDVQSDTIDTASRQVGVLFDDANRVLNLVIKNAINQLANQVFFHSELREYFTEGFDNHLMQNEEANLAFLFPFARAVKESASLETVSPIRIICATLTEFFEFARSHLYPDLLEMLQFECIKKLVLRYLLCLRDFLARAEAKRASATVFHGKLIQKTKTAAVSVVEGSKTVVNIVGKAVESVGRSLSPKEQSSLQQQQQQQKESINSELEADFDDNDVFSGAQIGEIKSDILCIMNMLLSIMNQNEVLQGGPYTVTADSELQQRMHGDIGSMLNFLTCTIDILAGEVETSDAVDTIIRQHYGIQPLAFNASDKSVYNVDLGDFIYRPQRFVHVSDRSFLRTIYEKNYVADTLTPSQSSVNNSHNYALHVSDMEVHGLEDYGFCAVRVTVGDRSLQSETTRWRQKLIWKQAITFDNILVSDHKFAMVEVVDIRQVRAELVHGGVTINLTDLHNFLLPPENTIKDKQRSSSISLMPNTATTAADGTKDMSDRSSVIDGWWVFEHIASGQQQQQAVDNAGKVSNTSNTFINVISAPTPRPNCTRPQIKLRIRMSDSM